MCAARQNVRTFALLASACQDMARLAPVELACATGRG
jgi:hypothetical protein